MRKRDEDIGVVYLSIVIVGLLTWALCGLGVLFFGYILK